MTPSPIPKREAKAMPDEPLIATSIDELPVDEDPPEDADDTENADEKTGPT
jgi:hypothetical protein